MKVPTKVLAKEVHSKYSTKRELHKFFAHNVGAYLPPEPNVTIWFMKDLMAGKKKCKWALLPPS